MTPDTFHADLTTALDHRAHLVQELRTALTGHQPRWAQFEETWSTSLRTPDRQLHTVIDIRLPRRDTAPDHDHPMGRPRFMIEVVKHDDLGRACDIATFDTVPDALAWAAQPRSDEPITVRARMEEARRYAQRDTVNLAGLTGRSIDSGRKGKRQGYQAIEFEGIGRVRITTLTPRQWRLTCNRRTRIVTAADGADAATTLRAAIEDLHGGAR